MKLLSKFDDSFLRISATAILFVLMTVFFAFLIRLFFFSYLLIFFCVIICGYPVLYAFESGRYQPFWIALVLSILFGGGIGIFYDEILLRLNPLFYLRTP